MIHKCSKPGLKHKRNKPFILRLTSVSRKSGGITYSAKTKLKSEITLIHPTVKDPRKPWEERGRGGIPGMGRED